MWVVRKSVFCLFCVFLVHTCFHFEGCIPVVLDWKPHWHRKIGHCWKTRLKVATLTHTTTSIDHAGLSCAKMYQGHLKTLQDSADVKISVEVCFIVTVQNYHNAVRWWSIFLQPHDHMTSFAPTLYRLQNSCWPMSLAEPLRISGAINNIPSLSVGYWSRHHCWCCSTPFVRIRDWVKRPCLVGDFSRVVTEFLRGFFLLFPWKLDVLLSHPPFMS